MNRCMEIITSWDDGSVSDMRMMELLTKYQIHGIFYLPTYSDLSEPEIKILHRNGFEIGGHTTTHPEDMKQLPPLMQENEILMNKMYLEELIGEKIKSFCYPGGKFNEITEGIVRKLGFENARTTNVGSITRSENLFRDVTTVHARPGRKEYKGIDWLTYAKMMYNEAKGQNGKFHIWGHSWELDELKQWDKLEELFVYIKNGVQ